MGIFREALNQEVLPPMKVAGGTEKFNIYRYKKENKIVLQKNRKEQYDIPIEDITNIEYVDNSKVVEKQKSVIIRAFIGSIFNSVGAIVGGMSGIGTKKKIKSSWLLIIETKEYMFVFEDKKKKSCTELFVRHVKKCMEKNNPPTTWLDIFKK